MAMLARYEVTAKRLEAAYAELRAHAQRVEGELAVQNRRLAASLDAMDRVLEALPLAVFREDGNGYAAINGRARTMIEEHGAIPTPSAVGGQVEEVGRDGVVRCFEGRSVATDDGALLFVEDRSEHVAMEAELRRLERLGGLAELALGIAHEIRNPLNGIAGFASLLQRDPRSERAADWAKRVAEGSKRVEAIVRDLLDFARPDREAATMALDLAATLELAAREVPTSIDEAINGQRVLGSRRTFEQVLSNLGRNSKEAGAKRAVVRLVRGGGRRLCLRFSDDGPGVDPALGQRIFDPFVGTKESGSGLGLAFAARAVEKMGGSLRLTSPSEGDLAGACFELEMPRAEPAEVHA